MKMIARCAAGALMVGALVFGVAQSRPKLLPALIIQPLVLSKHSERSVAIRGTRPGPTSPRLPVEEG